MTLISTPEDRYHLERKALCEWLADVREGLLGLVRREQECAHSLINMKYIRCS